MGSATRHHRLERRRADEPLEGAVGRSARRSGEELLTGEGAIPIEAQGDLEEPPVGPGRHRPPGLQPAGEPAAPRGDQQRDREEDGGRDHDQRPGRHPRHGAADGHAGERRDEAEHPGQRQHHADRVGPLPRRHRRDHDQGGHEHRPGRRQPDNDHHRHEHHQRVIDEHHRPAAGRGKQRIEGHEGRFLEKQRHHPHRQERDGTEDRGVGGRQSGGVAEEELAEPGGAGDAAGGDPREERDSGAERHAENDRGGGIVAGPRPATDEHEPQQRRDRRRQSAGEKERQVAPPAPEKKGEADPEERGVGRRVAGQGAAPQDGETADDAGCESDRRHPGGDDEGVVGGDPTVRERVIDDGEDHGVRPPSATARPISSRRSSLPAYVRRRFSGVSTASTGPVATRRMSMRATASNQSAALRRSW